jgi:hypothetical protein
MDLQYKKQAPFQLSPLQKLIKTKWAVAVLLLIITALMAKGCQKDLNWNAPVLNTLQPRNSLLLIHSLWLLTWEFNLRKSFLPMANFLANGNQQN